MEGYAGGAYVSASAVNTNTLIIIGLSTSPATNSDYKPIKYAIYFEQGAVKVFESEISRTIPATSYVVGDVLGVIYNGRSVKYLKNGVVLYTSTVPPSTMDVLHLDSSFYQIGSAVNNLVFGPTLAPDEFSDIFAFGTSIIYSNNNVGSSFTFTLSVVGESVKSAFRIGHYVRIFSDQSRFLEGNVTAVTSLTITVLITRQVGSASAYLDHAILLVGTHGDTGSTGPQGATGPQGNSGLQGATGTQGASGLQGATGASAAGGSSVLTVVEVSDTSQTITVADSNRYFYITNSLFSQIATPASTSTADGGKFWSFRNATNGYLSVALTNALGLTSPISIPPGNSVSLIVSAVTNSKVLLF